MSISRSSQLEVARALRSVPANPIFASNPQWPRAFSNRPPPLNGPLNRFTKSTLQIPEFPSKSKSNPHTNHVFSYFMVGTMGLLTGVGAKNTVNGERSPTTLFCSHFSKFGWLIRIDCRFPSQHVCFSRRTCPSKSGTCYSINPRGKECTLKPSSTVYGSDSSLDSHKMAWKARFYSPSHDR
jgi:hypothetical protein